VGTPGGGGMKLNGGGGLFTGIRRGDFITLNEGGSQSIKNISIYHSPNKIRTQLINNKTKTLNQKVINQS